MSLNNLLVPNELNLHCNTITSNGTPLDWQTGASAAAPVYIGVNAVAAGGTTCVAVGYNSSAAGTAGVAIGNQASAAGGTSLALGSGAVAASLDDISIGHTAGSTNTASTGVVKLAGIPAPAAAVGKASTHEVPITINGTVYNFLVSNI